MIENSDALPFLPYAKHAITGQDIDALNRALQAEAITRGPFVAEFEAEVANYCGALFAVAFNSGSTALHAACFAAQVSASDRLLTTPNSFIATAVAGTRMGAAPVFMDIDPAVGNIDVGLLEPNLAHSSSRGRNIVIPVHYAGIPVDMRALDGMIHEPRTVVIEDGAAALGSYYDPDYRVGCCEWSHMTVFSFHPAKLITTGEGGLVTTNCPDLDRRLRAYRNNGIERDPERIAESPGPWYYEVQASTGNYHMTDFQAALGLSQLSRIGTLIEARKEAITWYQHYLKGIPHVKLLPMLADDFVSPHLAVVQIDFDAAKRTRAQVMTELQLLGIGTQVHYIPLYRHPVYTANCSSLPDYFPGMEHFYQQALSLPLWAGLKEPDVQRICQTLIKVLGV